MTDYDIVSYRHSPPADKTSSFKQLLNMAAHILLFSLFLFACEAKGNSEIESLKKELEVFKKIILELKSTNEDLNTKLTAMENNQISLTEDLNRLRGKVVVLENDNILLKSKINYLTASYSLQDASFLNATTVTKKRMAEKHRYKTNGVISTKSSKNTPHLIDNFCDHQWNLISIVHFQVPVT